MRAAAGQDKNVLWYKRGISLVRYLMPEKESKELIKQQLSQLRDEAPIAKANGQSILIKELLLAQLDKVGDIFQVVKSFPIGPVFDF